MLLEKCRIAAPLRCVKRVISGSQTPADSVVVVVVAVTNALCSYVRSCSEIERVYCEFQSVTRQAYSCLKQFGSLTTKRLADRAVSLCAKRNDGDGFDTGLDDQSWPLVDMRCVARHAVSWTVVRVV